MKRFVDTNIFIYSITDHPKFGETAKKILKRIEHDEQAATSTLVLCEVAWVLEAMGKQNLIKPTLEKILSYRNLEITGFDQDDLLLGASYMHLHGIDSNDALNLAIMTKTHICEIYSNDHKHLAKVDHIKLTFE